VQLIRKVLYVGFFALLLNNFKGLADIVFQSFAGLGLKASGTAMTAADLMRPGFVASAGFDASRPLLEKAGELIGITTFFSNFVTIAVLLLAWVIVLLAFFVLAVQLFIAIIEFKLTTLAGFVLVPFALFGQTAFLAERVLGNVISSGIKLMVLAIVVGIGSSIFGTLVRPTADITLTQAASTILAAIAVFGLAIFVPGIAAGLITGAPQLGAGAAVATTAAAGGTVVAGGMLASGAARLAGRASGAAIRAAASLTGTVGAAYQAGGIRGVARATVTAPASRAVASGTAPVRDAYREGAAQGYRDAGPSSGPDPNPPGPGGGGPAGSPPAWAQRLARRQRMTQAGMIAAQGVREGDRPALSPGPDLKDKS
jgi:type IV secretion system protein TrbL